MSDDATKLRRALESWRAIAKAHGTDCRQGMGFCAADLCEEFGCMAARSKLTLDALDQTDEARAAQRRAEITDAQYRDLLERHQGKVSR